MDLITPYNVDDFINKVMLYQTNHVVIKIGPEGGILTLKLMRNHRIETVSFTDLPSNNYNSGYQWWNYDPEHDIIHLYDESWNYRCSCHLPELQPDGHYHMNVCNTIGENQEDTYFSIDVSDEEITNPQLGGPKMAYLLGHDWDDLKAAGGYYVDSLGNNNYNLHHINDSDLNIFNLREIHDHLIQRPGIKMVMITNKRSFTEDERFTNEKFILEKLCVSGVEFVYGPRSIVLELISALIVEINQYQLSHGNMLPGIDLIFERVITTYFEDRVERL